MSRFSAESPRVLIEKDEIRVGHGAAQKRFAYEWSPDTALAAWASDPQGGVQRGSRWDVVFADVLVRYLVVQWPAGLRGGAEREAYLAHRFREVHGVAAPDWRIVVERSVTAVPAIACAVPAVHVEAVAAWGRERRLRLGSVTGEFLAVYNRVRPALEHPFGALAVQRNGRITLGLWGDARWQALRSQPLGPAGDASLALYLESLAVSAERQGEPGVLYCVGEGPAVPAGWRKVVLDAEGWV
ncbi:hypothetical protein GPA22_16115 [Aromatoleum toluvorans]|uniref:Uncharacterized protein n=1 Tax=Aromatoleum toluvorans TaxID=92002 RepID=A0ABX1Q0M5_9RHOO|nr:hypothetical protein [Aromatoleum toluvorans]NMG45243.1 hypothetical protein [Aromatoleum toluvorans]